MPRTLAVTQNVTLDGVIDAAEGWFAPSEDSDDDRDQLTAVREQRAASDALLVRLFDDVAVGPSLRPTGSQAFGDGVVLSTYRTVTT